MRKTKVSNDLSFAMAAWGGGGGDLIFDPVLISVDVYMCMCVSVCGLHTPRHSGCVLYHTHSDFAHPFGVQSLCPALPPSPIISASLQFVFLARWGPPVPTCWCDCLLAPESRSVGQAQSVRTSCPRDGPSRRPRVFQFVTALFVPAGVSQRMVGGGGGGVGQSPRAGSTRNFGWCFISFHSWFLDDVSFPWEAGWKEH